MPTSSRKQIEVVLLSVIALLSVMQLRAFVEDRLYFFLEIMTLVFVCVLVVKAHPRIANTLAILMPLIPIIFSIAARVFATPFAFEISALTVFGVSSLAMAVGGKTNHWRSLSLVASGFLVLFCTSIAEGPSAIPIAMTWILGCVWHLVANHWERLDQAMPESVSRNWSLRPSTIIVTALVLAVAGFAVKDRFSKSDRLMLGWMPTSGGSKWSDPAARSGIGGGDAAIAAKDHAESFGAVDSDIFLETKESALFDMVNDFLGEATKQKIRREKRKAMGNDNVIKMHERAAKSEKGGSTFSIDRLPPKKHRHLEDAVGNSVVQWDGPTGIRLAMHRYDTFDGSEWSQTEDLSEDRLLQADIDKKPWFFDPQQQRRVRRESDSVSVGLLKVIRLDSTRLPVPMLTAGVHIKEIDRHDFYGIEKDGCLFMPGRPKIPSLTVVHVASTGLSEDEIRDKLATPTESKETDFPRLRTLARQVTADHDEPFDKLKTIVTHLRTEFTFDRNHIDDSKGGSQNSVSRFLQTRKGGDHLFATTAAMMARELGWESRLVTGFYVRPNSFDYAAGHAAVLPEDVHVWAEIKLHDGLWFEIEATPGFKQPDYQPSYWLVVRRFTAANWAYGVGLITLAIVGFVTRRIWIEWLLSCLWLLSPAFPRRQKVRLAMTIIETRARLAGRSRSSGRTQREWIEELTQGDARLGQIARQFCDAADSLFFGSSDGSLGNSATQLVRSLRARTILQLRRESL